MSAALVALAANTATHAETAPETGSIDFKYLYYRDWQPGGSRMRVSAPSVHFLMPLKNSFAIEGAFVMDAMSGASPLYHDTLSGASGMCVNDLRKAADVKLTRYFDRLTIGAGFAYSTEHDYVSRTFNTDVRISSADNNTTLAIGAGRSSDDIDSENRVVGTGSDPAEALPQSGLIRGDAVLGQSGSHDDDPFLVW